MNSSGSIEISLEEVAAGFICALRLEGVSQLELSSRADKAFIASLDPFIECAEASGYWCSFRPTAYFAPQRQRRVGELWTVPLTSLLLRRHESTSTLDFAVCERGAAALFTSLPGQSSWYSSMGRSYLKELSN